MAEIPYDHAGMINRIDVAAQECLRVVQSIADDLVAVCFSKTRLLGLNEPPALDDIVRGTANWEGHATDARLPIILALDTEITRIVGRYDEAIVGLYRLSAAKVALTGDLDELSLPKSALPDAEALEPKIRSRRRRKSRSLIG